MSFSTINELIVKVIAWLSKKLKWDMASTDHSETVLPINDPVVPSSVPSPIIPNALPNTPVEPILSPTAPTLEDFCLALRDFEGKPGDLNYKNNNPGNCRFNESGYLPIYGNVKRDRNGFAIFPTYELGWLYLKNMVKGQIHKRPNETLLQFMHRYAPPADNNPTEAYVNFIAKRLSVDKGFQMRNLRYN